MLLIIFLGLIAKLPSVSGDYDVGTQDMRNFDCTQVGTGGLTSFMASSF